MYIAGAQRETEESEAATASIECGEDVPHEEVFRQPKALRPGINVSKVMNRPVRKG